MAKIGFSSGDSTIKVNTTAVRNAVSELTQLNNEMDTEFKKVQTAMNALDSNWDGSASSSAMSKFNSVKSNFMGQSGRKAVMTTYIKFLSSVVADDYDQTETANTSLSDLFK